MDAAPRFVAAAPADAARELDAASVHLWRMAYDPSLGRGPLVDMLAAYLGMPASAVVLDETAKGKPLLRPASAGPVRAQALPSGPSLARAGTHETDATLLLRSSGQACPREADAALSFNWSHSGDYALVALARGGALGVDIERLRERPRALDLARRFFDPAEAQALAALEPALQQRAFIGLWCAKEAVLKATGEGLSFGLARLAFTWRTGMDWSLARTDPVLGEMSTWQCHGFDALPGYRGALAWRGGARTVRAFDLNATPARR